MTKSQRQDLPDPMHSSETGGCGVNLVSIVGFGLVGRAIAARLFAIGHRVLGDDIAPGARAFVAQGVLVVADAAQTSRSIRTC